MNLFKLEQMIRELLQKHTYRSDRHLVADVYAHIFPNRYDFHKFLYLYTDGEIPTSEDIITLKTKIQNDETSL